MTLDPAIVESGAILSPCLNYRYRLWRRWGEVSAGTATFLMLNPSIADAESDDPTIRKCIGFATRMGCTGIMVINLFAWRSTMPEGLLFARDPIGEGNDRHIAEVADLPLCNLLICAWGACGGSDRKLRDLIKARAVDVVGTLKRAPMCLGTTRDGSPRHPLMLPYSAQLQPWRFQ